MGPVGQLPPVADPAGVGGGRNAPRSTASRASGGRSASAELRDLGDADGIPGFERTELPAETPSHRPIDVVDGVRDGGGDASGVDECRSERRAQKRADRILPEEQRANARGGIVDRTRRLERGQAHLSLRGVLEGLRIERQDRAVRRPFL